MCFIIALLHMCRGQHPYSISSCRWTLTSNRASPEVATSSKPDCRGCTRGGDVLLLRKSWLNTLAVVFLAIFYALAAHTAAQPEPIALLA